MERVSHRYYKHSKTFLSLISLWPYDKRWPKQILRMFICLLLASGAIMQLTTCVTTRCTGDVLLKLLPYVVVSLVFLLKYASICFKTEAITYIFELMERNWHTLKDEGEVKIFKKYSEHSRLFSICFAIFMLTPLVAFTLSQFIPNFLDILLPLNESRPHQMAASTEYFVDEQKYFYFLLIHVNLVVYIGTMAIVANETVIIITLHHICALFKIVSYRLNSIYNRNATSQYSDRAIQCVTHESVIDVVKAHKNAIQFANAFLRNFPTAYFPLLSLGIISITLCLYRLHQALVLMDDMPELVNALCHLAANLMYLFFTNFLGQSVMDHSSRIFVDIYCIPWYTASLSAQHTLLFAMQRSIEAWGLSVGGVFVPCFEGFSMIIRMAMSYFMALRSIQ